MTLYFKELCAIHAMQAYLTSAGNDVESYEALEKVARSRGRPVPDHIALKSWEMAQAMVRCAPIGHRRGQP